LESMIPFPVHFWNQHFQILFSLHGHNFPIPYPSAAELFPSGPARDRKIDVGQAGAARRAADRSA
jgi:hypothetical protein